MYKKIIQAGLTLLVMMPVGIMSAAEKPGFTSTAIEQTQLKGLIDQPVDISPWA